MDAIGDAHHELHVVLDEQDREREVVAQPVDELLELLDLLVVESAGGLVEQEQPRA